MELSKVSKIQGLFKRVHLSLIGAFYYLCLSLAVLSISACGGGGWRHGCRKLRQRWSRGFKRSK